MINNTMSKKVIALARGKKIGRGGTKVGLDSAGDKVDSLVVGEKKGSGCTKARLFDDLIWVIILYVSDLNVLFTLWDMSQFRRLLERVAKDYSMVGATKTMGEVYFSDAVWKEDMVRLIEYRMAESWRLNKIRTANKAVGFISNDRLRVKALGLVAEAQAEIGDIKKAKETYAKTKGFIPKFTPSVKACVLNDLATSKARAGFYKEAMQTLDLIEDRIDRIEALLEIIEVKKNVGDSKEVANLLVLVKRSIELEKKRVGSIADNEKKDKAQRNLKWAQSEFKSIQANKKTVKSKNGFTAVIVRNKIESVRVQVEAGLIEEVKKKANLIKEHRLKRANLTTIAYVQAERGEIQEALETVVPKQLVLELERMSEFAVSNRKDWFIGKFIKHLTHLKVNRRQLSLWRKTINKQSS